jgi:tetratricopeptide (TPR) repeat protein
MPTDTPTFSQWRARPVFISSTFKDMQAERSYLQSHVFPRLEEKLRERRHQFEPIDLRMGVETAELGTVEAREALVLKVCLEEIQRSRPFLIVILGDRYGWVPPPERMENAVQEAGFDTEVKGKSVTALEIEFGVLKEHPDQRQRSFFYFREPLPYDRMPEDIAAQYSDAHSPDATIRAGHDRLLALKRQISADPEFQPRVHSYHPTWDEKAQHVIGLEAWGDLVFQHLWSALEEETHDFASQPPETWEQQERAARSEFVAQRSRDFTGREPLITQLLDIATSPFHATDLRNTVASNTGTTWGACVTGSPGSGKSALLAELYQRLAKNGSVLILANAAGATPRGSEPDAMLRRFIGELATALGIADPLPENARPDKVDAAFASMLAHAALQTRVVVLLDALDQFDPTPRGQYLTWLRVRQWPGNARIIATGITGTTPVEALIKNEGVEALELPALAALDVTEIAKRVWAHYHRQVNPEVLRVLAGKKLPDGSPAAGNPLWLTLALEQINLLDADDFARAERDFTHAGGAGERLRALLVDTATRMPPDVPSLYGWLLEQTEKVFGAAPARAFAVLIALGRIGWRECDLLSLVPIMAGLLYPKAGRITLDELSLANLRRGFRAHLMRRGSAGQLDFFHAQMRQAVRLWALRDVVLERSIHQAVADHLAALPWSDSPGIDADPLRQSELMHHLIGAGDAEHVAQLLADYSGPYALRSATGYSAKAPAIQSLAHHLSGANSAHLEWVVSLLSQPGLTDEQVDRIAARFSYDLLPALEAITDVQVRRALAEAVLAAKRQAVAAAPDRSERQFSLASAMNLVSDIATSQGDFATAEKLAAESRAIGETLASTGNVTDTERPTTPEEADEQVRWAQRRTETRFLSNWNPTLDAQAMNWDDPQTLNNYLQKQEEIRAANDEIVRDRKAELARIEAEIRDGKLAQQEVLCIALDNLGDVAHARGNLAMAKQHYTESLAIRERMAASDQEFARWVNSGTGPIEEPVMYSVVTSPMKADRHNNLAASLSRLGSIALKLDDLEEASRCFIRSRGILQRLVSGDPDNIFHCKTVLQFNLAKVALSLGNIATKRDQMAAASDHYTEALDLLETVLAREPDNTDYQIDLALVQSKIGCIAMAAGDLSGAQTRYANSLAVIDRVASRDPANLEWQQYHCHMLDSLASVAVERRDYAEAFRLRSIANQIVRASADRSPEDVMSLRSLVASHAQLAALADVMGNQATFQQELQSCLEVMERMKQRGVPFDDRTARLYDQCRVTLLSDCEGYAQAAEAPIPLAAPHTTMPSAPRPLDTALAHLRDGRAQAALDLLRPLVFPNDALDMDQGAPLEARLAFIQALWLTQNEGGVLAYLPRLREQDNPRVQALRECLEKWQKSLSWMQKLGFGKKTDASAY